MSELDFDGFPKIRWGHVFKAGTVFQYSRYERGEEDPDCVVVYILLEDRCATPEDVINDVPGAQCLIVSGHMRGGGPGDIVRLKGIIDCSKEIEL